MFSFKKILTASLMVLISNVFATIVLAKVDGPSVFWKYSLWGKRRAFTEGAETLSKRSCWLRKPRNCLMEQLYLHNGSETEGRRKQHVCLGKPLRWSISKRSKASRKKVPEIFATFRKSLPVSLYNGRKTEAKQKR